MSTITSSSEDSVILDVQHSLEERLKMSTGIRDRKKFTIFRVPQKLRSGSGTDAYEPNILSIGPYHHGKKDLEAMEAHKCRYLPSFLQRNTRLELKDYVRKMKELESEARNCYSEDVNMDSRNFIEMLLVDGCFVVELLLRFVEDNKADDYPLVGTKWTFMYIFSDLLKLENQLPFFILQDLFDMAAVEYYPPFIEIVVHCSQLNLLKNLKPPPQEQEFQPNHILHLFHHSLVHRNTPPHEHPICRFSPFNFLNYRKMKTFCCLFLCCIFLLARKRTKPRSARRVLELQEAGVKFKIKDQGSFLDVTFSDGALVIKPLYLGDFSIPTLRNFIALEQCNKKYGTICTSYACFVDDLVDTAMDVAILEAKGVLINELGSNDEAAQLINQLCKGIIHNACKDHLTDVLADMNRYCNSSWPKWRAKLARDYFNNPWAIISFMAAVILLLLSTAQTVLAILSYVPPKS